MSNRFRLFRLRAIACASLIVVTTFTGCKHLGPTSIAVDRFDYSNAIAESWKQQTLLNIVKLRYMDLPVFMDVASVVSGYSLQTGVSFNGTISTDTAVQATSVRLAARPFILTAQPSPTSRRPGTSS